MKRLHLLFLLLPLMATAQLKEFEVSEMERPDVAVVQANAQWPDDALLLVYSSLDGVQFRSSMGAVDKQTYNNTAGRYEILVKPLKQMIFVAKPGFMELKIATINPNPKDVFYYKVEEKQQAVVNTEPGTLKIITEPSGADIQLNGIPVSTKTPFTGELNPGSTRIKLQKAKHETIDTTVAVRSGEPTVLNLQMKPTTLWVNISSMPSGASVTLDGTSRGTTPASFELDLTDRTKRGSKKLQLALADHETISTTIDLRPSATPLEKDYSLKKEKGSFSITSTPEGAQVFIDEKFSGTTPFRGNVEAGSYNVKINLGGYVTSDKTMRVSSASIAELDFELRPESLLKVKLTSTPSGASVFFDGVDRGKTPVSFDFDISQKSLKGKKTIKVPIEIKLAYHETISDIIKIQSKGLLENNFKLKSINVSLHGIVTDYKTKEPIADATVSIVGTDGSSFETTTDSKGKYSFDLAPATSYVIVAGKKDYYLNKIGKTTTVIFEGDKDLVHDFELNPINRVIDLPNIFYDLGKWDLRPESKVALDGLVETLNDNPTIVIELGSHTDTRASDSYNLSLSQKRAQSVVDYLIENGIAKARLVAKGYGETTPKVLDVAVGEFPVGSVINDAFIAKLKTEGLKEMAHNLNRRTEFKVLRNNYKQR